MQAGQFGEKLKSTRIQLVADQGKRFFIDEIKLQFRYGSLGILVARATDQTMALFCLEQIEINIEKLDCLVLGDGDRLGGVGRDNLEHPLGQYALTAIEIVNALTVDDKDEDIVGFHGNRERLSCSRAFGCADVTDIGGKGIKRIKTGHEDHLFLF